MKSISFVLIFCFSTHCIAQDTLAPIKDSLTDNSKNLIIGAYLDLYYGYSSVANTANEIPCFVSMNRNNDFSINLAFIDAKYSSDRIRARFAPGFGSYMNANYSKETGGFKHIVEASIGYKLFPNKNIWLDGGVLGSPYTNETAISKDHLMYSRSLAPEYVPYYLCGAKLSVPLSTKLTAYLYLINGWQQITDQNSSKSLGTQLEFKPDSKNLFNWDVYYGNERSIYTPNYKNRYFTDFYWTHNLNGKWAFTSCIYGGLQEIDSTKTENNFWMQANFMARWRFSTKASIAVRVEYFEDNKGVQINSFNPIHSGFSTLGYGICYSYQISKEALFRLEGRALVSDKAHFAKQNSFSKELYWLMGSLVFYLNN